MDIFSSYDLSGAEGVALEAIETKDSDANNPTQPVSISLEFSNNPHYDPLGT